MKHLKTAGYLTIFIMAMSFKGFSQDTAVAAKKAYEIYPSKNRTLNMTEVQNLPKTNSAVYSTDIDKVNRKVTVSYLQKDGTIKKETYDLIEDKK